MSPAGAEHDTNPMPSGQLNSYEQRLLEFIKVAVRDVIAEEKDDFAQRWQDITDTPWNESMFRSVVLVAQFGADLQLKAHKAKQTAASLCWGGICTIIRKGIALGGLLAVATVITHFLGAQHWIVAKIQMLLPWK